MEKNILNFKKKVLSELKQSTNKNESINDSYTVEIIPFLELDKSANILSNDFILYEHILINEYKAEVIIKYNNRIIKSLTRVDAYSYHSRVFIKDTINDKFLDVLRDTNFNTNFICFFNFFNHELASRKTLISIDPKITFIELEDNQLYDFHSIIKYKYGSVEKLIEKYKKEQYKDSLIINNLTCLDDAKNIIRKCPITYYEYYPTDTLTVLNMFLNQMNDLITIQPSQLKLLRKLLIEKITSYRFVDDCSFKKVRFLDREIDYVVSSVLTDSQYVTYIKKLNDFITLRSESKQFISKSVLQTGLRNSAWINELDKICKEIFCSVNAD
ncbi:MAG: hypothetical protein IPO21_20930 [Bacteroidales bacterium]|nr:hypothetical protein [Bacteroidales bacterium]